MVRRTKYALLTSFLFFLSLAAWSVSSPIGSGNDTDYHLGSIWCARGESKGLCESIDLTTRSGPTAVVPFMFQMCDGRPIEYQPSCPTIQSEPEMQFLRTAPPQQENFYYRLMSTFASQNTHLSILLIRSINAFVASAILCALLLVSRGKTRLAIAASWTIGLVPVAVQNFSSVNPRGWSYLSVFAAWGFLASALESPPRSWRSYLSFLFLILSSALAFATRIDGSTFVLFSCAAVAVTFALKSYVISRQKIYYAAASLVGIAVLIRSIPLYLKLIFRGLQGYIRDSSFVTFSNFKSDFIKFMEKLS